MKKLFTLSLILCALCVSVVNSEQVQLSWRYPKDHIGGDLAFYVRHSPTLTAPIEQWEIADVITFERPVLLSELPEVFSSRVFTIEHDAHFFVVTASNFLSHVDVGFDISKPVVPVLELGIHHAIASADKP